MVCRSIFPSREINLLAIFGECLHSHEEKALQARFCKL